MKGRVKTIGVRPRLSHFEKYTQHCIDIPYLYIQLVSSVRSSNSHPDLLLIHHHHPLFQITQVLNTGLSLSEPLQLYKGYNAI